MTMKSHPQLQLQQQQLHSQQLQQLLHLHQLQSQLKFQQRHQNRLTRPDKSKKRRPNLLKNLEPIQQLLLPQQQQQLTRQQKRK